MDDAKELRDRIDAAEKNGRGRREYGAELRRDLVEYARQRIVEGGSATSASKELGLNPATVVNWLKADLVRDTARPKMQRVEAAMATSRRSGLVLLLGDDVRVQGLSIDELVELVSKLR